MPVKTIKDPSVVEQGDRPLERSKALQLVVKRCDEIRAFLVAIKEPSLLAMLDDDQLFATLLSLAINDYTVRQKDIASALGVSVAQVGRWASGEHAPRPYARGQVVQAVAHLLERALTEIAQKTAV